MKLYTINSGHLSTIDIPKSSKKYKREIAKLRGSIREGKQDHRLYDYRIHTTYAGDGALFTIATPNRVELVTGFIYLTEEESSKVKEVAAHMIDAHNLLIRRTMGNDVGSVFATITDWPAAPSCNVYLHAEPTLLMAAQRQTTFKGLSYERAMLQMGRLETIITLAVLEVEKRAWD